MLDVAARYADGALPAGRPPEETAATRTALGPGALLVVYFPLTETGSPGRVADTVRAHLAAGADHVVLGQGYDADFAGAVDRLVALAPQLGLG